MPQKVILAVQGGTIHAAPIDHIFRLQALIGAVSAESHPIFLRLGAIREIAYQPVAARTLLAEIERFLPLLKGRQVPGIAFYGEDGQELGGFYGGEDETIITKNETAQLSITAQGIHLLLQQFPPPIGFRSSPSLEKGWFECYFQALHHGPASAGIRTPAMGGSGAPVALPDLPAMPPVTRWHHARVAGRASVAVTAFSQTPAEEVYRDLLHAITAACTESLRLRRPLRISLE